MSRQGLQSVDRVGYCKSVRGDDGCQQRGEGGSGGGKSVYPTIKFLSSQIPHVTQMHNNHFELGSLIVIGVALC